MPKTEVQTKTRILSLVGKYDPTTIKDDIDGIRNYYHSLGYLDVQITSEEKLSADDESTTEVHYQIKEGVRYPQPKTSQIRNISPIQPGDVDPKKLHPFRIRLVQSAYFDVDDIGRKPTNQSLRKN